MSVLLKEFFKRDAGRPVVQQHAQRVNSNQDVITRYKEQLRLNRLKNQQATQPE